MTEGKSDREGLAAAARTAVDSQPKGPEEEAVIRLADLIIANAVPDHASDIHIDPERDSVRLRFRIDGVLHDIYALDKSAHEPLIARLKQMADMNVSERSRPQDGRIHVIVSGRELDLRVGVVPTVLGEKATIRLLSRGAPMLGLDNIGLTSENRALIDKALRQPTGMILCSGPTGSGKTTVLYSMVMEVVEPSKQVFTVEEPVEHLLPGVVQIQVNRNAGVTAATAMRSLVRNDPDVIMVGEIRDLETMELAIQAALTGHLVLSQLHTNDAASTLTRMLDMGVEPFMVASTVVATTNQRLVRMVCGECGRPHQPSQALLGEMRRASAAGGYTVPADAEFVAGEGCAHCRQTGYYGRAAIFEVLLATPALMERLERGAPVEELREAAVREGMVTLVADGVRKAVEGVTTLEEVARVTMSSRWH